MKKNFSVVILLKKIVKKTITTVLNFVTTFLNSVVTMIKAESKGAVLQQYFHYRNIKR